MNNCKRKKVGLRGYVKNRSQNLTTKNRPPKIAKVKTAPPKERMLSS